MKKALVVTLIVFSFVAFSGAPLYAASPWTEASTYSEKSGQKLGFGLKNLLLGWTELFAAPERAKNNGENVFVGFGKGIGNFVVYTVGGALHVVTFFIPIDVPLPNNGVDIDTA